MRFLIDIGSTDELEPAVAVAGAARSAGLDGVLIGGAGALVGAAALAARVPDILLAAEVELGADHPIEIAEEVAVVDQLSGGRLIVVARAAAGASRCYREALDLLRLALAPAPFRFEGECWRVPARLEANVNAPERARMTPAPLQPRVEIWGEGTGVPRDAALERALGYLATEAEEPGELAVAWSRLVGQVGPASIGAPRARRHRFSAATGGSSARKEAEALVSALTEGREAFRQDWAVVSATIEDVPEIGARVRPRVQLDRLPDGLAEFWDETIDDSRRDAQAR